MSKIKQFFETLIGLRKLLFTILTIGCILLGMLMITTIFLVSWYYNAEVLSGDNLEAVYRIGFQYMAMIAGAYLAINVANKWVSKWIKRK